MRFWPRRPATEETLIDEEGKLVDAVVNGKRLTYAHEISPERGVLTAYKPGEPDTVELEFCDAHRRGTNRKGKVWTRVLEEIVYHQGADVEEFRSPQGGIFEYVDREGNVFRATAHDPVANAVVSEAKQRYSELTKQYAELLREVQAEARRKVSR